MKLAVNYSQEVDELLRDGEVKVDLFKCPDWDFEDWNNVLERALSLRPVYIHFNFQAGQGKMSNIDWNTVRSLREATQTPYVNIHISPRVKDFPDIAFDSMDEDNQSRVLNSVIKDVTLAVEECGAENVIVEHVPWWANPEGFLRIGVEPQTMHTVLEETNCGFLLDLSHARIAAMYLERDEKEYIEAFPLERLREFHNTGLGWEDDRRMDHLPLTDDDWIFFDWALERINQGDWPAPWAMAFEYGGLGPKFAIRSEKSVLAAQLPRLYDLIHQV